ncbi:MAG: hypothetical protein P8O08_21215 [Paracoccaceae bacterium]|nr:hypothetical protein [Paracoccaceae bacterium]
MSIKLRKILTLACAEQYCWAKGNCAKTQLPVTLLFFKGWRGLLISPSLFTQRAFDTPECALIIDDICLSGQLEVNNIKIRLTKDDGIRTTGRQNKLVRSAGKKINGLRWFELSKSAIECFRDKSGILRN